MTSGFVDQMVKGCPERVEGCLAETDQGNVAWTSYHSDGQALRVCSHQRMSSLAGSCSHVMPQTDPEGSLAGVGTGWAGSYNRGNDRVVAVKTADAGPLPGSCPLGDAEMIVGHQADTGALLEKCSDYTALLEEGWGSAVDQDTGSGGKDP